MTKKQSTLAKSKKLDRYFLILKVFLTATPILCYFYVSMNGLMSGQTFQQVLQATPSLTVVFLIAMLNPYVAYLVHLIQKKLETNDMNFVSINMVLLLLAQLLTMNLVYFTMLAFVFYQTIRYYHIDLFPSIRNMNVKQSIFCGGGSMFVMMISCVCLFATIQLM